MSILTKESDLLKFIDEKKKKKIDIHLETLYRYYIKCISNTLVNSYDKLINLKYTIECLNTINNLFWLLFNYTKNIKLTMFLCERSQLLFTEYILMINIPLYSINNSKISLDLLEVKNFVYKKTIGPLKIFNKQSIKSISPYYLTFCYLSNNIFSILFIKIKKESDSIEDIKKKNNEYKSIILESLLATYFKKNIFINNNCKLLTNFTHDIDFIDSLKSIQYLNIILIINKIIITDEIVNYEYLKQTIENNNISYLFTNENILSLIKQIL